MNITRPTLLIDEVKCRANIAKMVAIADRAHAILRPHFKTHQSARIADWFREAGIDQCTVSSVSMAQYFAENHWNDITIAFPYNPLEANEINRLASMVELNILLESEASLQHAKDHLTEKAGFFIKIDVGTHRTGLDHRHESTISNLVNTSSDQLTFKGFLAHAGHTYKTKSKKNVTTIFDKAKNILLPLKEKFGGVLSYGDTPSCSMIEDLSMYDEIRPGNFVFYDWMQYEIGSCNVDEIAVCLACPVVALHSERNEAVVYGGAVHLSKDQVESNDEASFGKVARLKRSGWESEIVGNVVRVSQEHGIVQLPDKFLTELKVGDLIGIIPVHSCLTADLQGNYFSTNGDYIDKILKN
ncbi:MAG: alanine racemase [Bacteroidota bacterium]